MKNSSFKNNTEKTFATAFVITKILGIPEDKADKAAKIIESCLVDFANKYLVPVLSPNFSALM